MTELDAKHLIEALPDLSLMIRRDGVILCHIGGRGLEPLLPAADSTGARLESIWPVAVATVVKQLVRRAIASRSTEELPFKHAGIDYEARVSAKGPDRAICVIRPAMHSAAMSTGDAAADPQRPQMDRRGFLRRLQATLSLAVVSEKPASIAVIYLEGVNDIARVVDAKVSEQVLSAALVRLPFEAPRAGGAEPWWYVGQLQDNLLAVVLESADRDAIESCVSGLCTSLREPVGIGDATFHLTPFSGVAILGQDATSPKNLIEHARSAATESRRSRAPGVRFFTDTLKLRSLARLDVTRELREAISNRDIRLRYIGRHDLSSGRLVAHVGYFRWMHPLRGEVQPVEFLGVAETTGLARLLSQTVLHSLVEDYGALAHVSAEVRMSFGPSRHHLLHDDFVTDIQRFLADGGLEPMHLELRLAERTFNVIDPQVCKALRDLGVQLVVDEVGRGMGSFDRLARAPIWGLQLDRAWVTALRRDPVALKVCRAGISAAQALGLAPIATGVDDPEQREALLGLGCKLGSGDLYGKAAADIMLAPPGPAEPQVALRRAPVAKKRI